MRLTSLADECRLAGLTVVEIAGWKTRGAELGKVGAVIAHHTASARSASDEAVDRLLRDGRPGIPGPLSQVGLDRRGRVRLIAAGLANHAGAGAWRGISGNSRAVGVEAYNDGKGEPWPTVQLQAWDVLNAVLLRLCNLPAAALCGHREWAPTRKVDPHGVDLIAMRGRAAGLLAPKPAPTPPPAVPPTSEEDDMRYKVIRKADGATALIAPGYFRHVDPEELAVAVTLGQASGTPQPVNDREWDVARAVAIGSDQ